MSRAWHRVESAGDSSVAYKNVMHWTMVAYGAHGTTVYDICTRNCAVYT